VGPTISQQLCTQKKKRKKKRRKSRDGDESVAKWKNGSIPSELQGTQPWPWRGFVMQTFQVAVVLVLALSHMRRLACTCKYQVHKPFSGSQDFSLTR
jgi:hypothetical protein